MVFDYADLKILRLLQEDAGRLTEDLSRQVNIPASRYQRKMERFKALKVIAGAIAVIDAEVVGFPTTAFVFATLRQHDAHAIQQFEEMVVTDPSIQDCFSVFDEIDYILKVVMEDPTEFTRFRRRMLRANPKIKTMHSLLALETINSTTALPI